MVEPEARLQGTFDPFDVLAILPSEGAEAPVSTTRTAQVYVTNLTDGNATISLYHNNSSNGTQQGTWQAAPGAQVGPLPVRFETGIGSWGIPDYWAIELEVDSGSTPGVYESSGVLQYSDWKECQLQGSDGGRTWHSRSTPAPSR